MLEGLREGFTTLMSPPPEATASDRLFQAFAVDQTKKFGEGGYGATFAAHAVATKQPLAVKIIDTRRMRLEAIRRECHMMEQLDHPNVIKVLGHGTGRASTGQQHLYFIFMECASGGELFDQVIDRGANAMPEEVARGFMRGLLAGVQHCHEHGIAHRDLKLENVLLTREGTVKVIDFGLSHQYQRGADGAFDRSAPLTDMCGSKSYAAPEVLSGRGYDGFAADVWSLGVSLFAMLSGFFPLDEATSKDWRYTKMAEGQRRGKSTTALVYGWYKRSTAHLSGDVVALLDSMLAIDPAKRRTLPEVLKHPWMVGAQPMQLGGPAKQPWLLEANQGSYNAHELVGADAEGPVWRSAIVTGPGVQDLLDYDDDAMDECLPVYRSLGLSPTQPLPMPALGRQKAMSRLDA
mmetsp:Transcript_40591/g.131395  ORF Transcript_40591/g.131395 Transcript_40591/m.131395 type:complete len:406 (-) Transcript_40591:267-1484(-)